VSKTIKKLVLPYRIIVREAIILMGCRRLVVVILIKNYINY